MNTEVDRLFKNSMPFVACTRDVSMPNQIQPCIDHVLKAKQVRINGEGDVRIFLCKLTVLGVVGDTTSKTIANDIATLLNTSGPASVAMVILPNVGDRGYSDSYVAIRRRHRRLEEAFEREALRMHSRRVSLVVDPCALGRPTRQPTLFDAVMLISGRFDAQPGGAAFTKSMLWARLASTGFPTVTRDMMVNPVRESVGGEIELHAEARLKQAFSGADAIAKLVSSLCDGVLFSEHARLLLIDLTLYDGATAACALQHMSEALPGIPPMSCIGVTWLHNPAEANMIKCFGAERARSKVW